MRRLLTTAVSALLIGLPLEAQNLREEVEKFFVFGDCGTPICLLVGTGHGDHFNPQATQGQRSLIGFLTNSIGRSIASFPISSASSGQTFRTVEGGVPVPTSTSAGPIFAERAQTLGRGAFLLGANVTGFSFKTLRGERLDDLGFTFTHQNILGEELGDPGFENDLVDVTLDLSVSSLVASFFVTWGVLDRLDVSVAVPFVRAEIRGQSRAEVIPVGTGLGTPHRFSPTNLITATSEPVNAATSGIGDIAVRLKLNLTQTESSGFALLADARLPTGEEADFLGSGEVAVRGLAIYSAQVGDFSPHVNAGFLGRGGDLLNDAFLATVGFDQLLVPWFTLAADLISEWQVGSNKILIPEPVTFTSPEVRTVDLAPFPDSRDNLVDLAIGAKLNPTSGLTVIANLLIPVNQSRGLRPDAAWTAGVEYKFGR